MFSKILLLFFVLSQLAVIRSDDEYFYLHHLRTIQNEIFDRMALYTQVTWNETAAGGHNFYFFPLLVKLNHYLVLMKLYYDTIPGIPISQELFLGKPYALASLFVKMQNTSKIELEYPNILFFDQRYTSWRYLEDITTRYRTEKLDFPFEPEYEQRALILLNDWIYRKTNEPRIKSLQMKGLTSFHTSALIFNACWNHTGIKTITNYSYEYEFIETISTRHRRFVTTMSGMSIMSSLERAQQQVEVDSFNANGLVGYYNNSEYEAIRIPFINGEYAMAVILPYYNQSLEIFKKLTTEDYRQLLRRLNETASYKYVNYTIPTIISTTFLINENGAFINRGDECDATSNLMETNDTDMSNSTSACYKKFFVDRPFGILIYHEKTAFVLMHALVRNSSSVLWPIPKFRIRINKDGEEENY